MKSTVPERVARRSSHLNDSTPAALAEASPAVHWPATPRHPAGDLSSGMSDPTDHDAERWMDLEVKLAFQDRLIRDLDALVREFGARLDSAERELKELKRAVPAPLPLGTANERPPHY
jgi:uncharacterized coiled-coil protein SlyX